MTCGHVQAGSPHCTRCQAWPLVESTSVLFEDAQRESTADSSLAPTSSGARLLRYTGKVTLLLGGTLVAGTLLFSLATTTGKGYQVAPVLALMVLVMFGIPAALMLGRSIANERVEPEALPPRRWQRALPGSGALAGASGILGCAQPLSAPLSGRSCAAVEIGIRLDDDHEGAAETWLLLESRSAPLRVGRVSVDADLVRLSTGRQRLHFDESSIATLARYLADRGLDVAPEDCVVFESIASAGGRATLTIDEDGATTLHA